jgi:hypothetical protein
MSVNDHIFQDVVPSLDAHTEELHRAILGAQRLIRAYDRAAHEVVLAWETREFLPEELARAVAELQRVYERRQV